MNLDDYQQQCLRTYPEDGDRLHAPLYGLAGEVGELVDMMKKVYFHGHDYDRDRVIEELGDIMYYLAVCAKTHGVNLSEVAAVNQVKLRRRYPNGFSKEASRNRKKGKGK